MIKVKRKPTVTQLKKKLDKIFSKFIRMRDGHICCTCGKRMTPEESQAGHYISRSYLATRFDEKNVNCQCVGCNVFRNGNMPSYTLFLQREYGYHIIAELYKKSQEITKNFPYEAKIKYYESKNL